MANTAKQVYEQSTQGLQRIFQAENTESLDLTIQFTLTGVNGIEFYAHVYEKQLSFVEGKLDRPKVTMKMTAEDFLDMLSGAVSTTDAFASGKLKVGGNLFYAMKLAPVFKFGSA